MSFQLPAYIPPDFIKGAAASAPDAVLLPAPDDFTAPGYYHATTIYPEYIKAGGRWHLLSPSRMDCAAVYENGRFTAREFRHIKRGDMVAAGRKEDGSEGILVNAGCFVQAKDTEESFSFRRGRSRETAFSADYDFLLDLLRHERENGCIVWVLGPACSFDAGSRRALASLIKGGYAHALLTGNALAVHDLEGAYLGTALGRDIYTHQARPNGHYNHIDTINRVRARGSIEKFIKAEGITDGIIASCIERGVPYVLTGSIRDDGPLPGVYGDVYAGQDAMRSHLSNATTVIALATALHAIASGNMTPCFKLEDNGNIRPVYFYTVDVSEFAANKLADRGSLSSKSVISNVQDFLARLERGLCRGV